MKLAPRSTPVELPEGVKVRDYGVDPVIMQFIAREKMMSNALKTFIQEALTNAIDAHTERAEAMETYGPPAERIEVNIPSSLDPEFRIRDYGIGIDEDRMTTLLTVYGKSSKRASNSQVGGFGLGGKAAFAVAESFTMETVWLDADGQRWKSVWWHFIAQSGGNSYAELSRTETDEDFGTLISVTIEEEDWGRVAEYVAGTCQFWPNRPIVTGAELTYVDFTSKLLEDDQGNDWFMPSKLTDGVRNGVTAVIGGIQYPVNYNLLDLNDGAEKVCENPLYLFFPSGTVDVTATREAIDYSTDTKSVLEKRLNATHEAIERMVRDTHQADLKLFSQFDIKLQGYYYTMDYGKLRSQRLYDARLRDGVKMFIEGELGDAVLSKRIKHFLKENPTITYVYVLSGTDNKFSWLSDLPCVDSLPNPPVEKRVRRKPADAYIVHGGSITYRPNWKRWESGLVPPGMPVLICNQEKGVNKFYEYGKTKPLTADELSVCSHFKKIIVVRRRSAEKLQLGDDVISPMRARAVQLARAKMKQRVNSRNRVKVYYVPSCVLSRLTLRGSKGANGRPISGDKVIGLMIDVRFDDNVPRQHPNSKVKRKIRQLLTDFEAVDGVMSRRKYFSNSPLLERLNKIVNRHLITNVQRVLKSTRPKLP